MRIIAGAFRSRTIDAPHGEKTRPTSDRARETLFNILANVVSFEGMSVLDLFAGSGAFAFEALSRGAAKAVCIDRSSAAIRTMKTNAAALGVEAQTTLIRADVYDWIGKTDNRFGLIFADPPYDDPGILKRLPALLLESRLLSPDSIVIIEHRFGSELALPQAAVVVKERNAGEAQFSFIQRRGDTDIAATDSTGNLPRHV